MILINEIENKKNKILNEIYDDERLDDNQRFAIDLTLNYVISMDVDQDLTLEKLNKLTWAKLSETSLKILNEHRIFLAGAGELNSDVSGVKLPVPTYHFNKDVRSWQGRW